MRIIQIETKPFSSLLAAIGHFIGFLLSSLLVFGSFTSFEGPWAFVIGCLSILGVFYFYFTPTLMALNLNKQEDEPTTLHYALIPLVFIGYLVSISITYFRYKNKPVFNTKWTDYSFFDVVKLAACEAASGQWDDRDIEKFGTISTIQHPSILWIFLINLFLGGTFIFYVIAFIWARSPKKIFLDESSKSTAEVIGEDYFAVYENLNTGDLEIDSLESRSDVRNIDANPDYKLLKIEIQGNIDFLWNFDEIKEEYFNVKAIVDKIAEQQDSPEKLDRVSEEIDKMNKKHGINQNTD